MRVVGEEWRIQRVVETGVGLARVMLAMCAVKEWRPRTDATSVRCGEQEECPHHFCDSTHALRRFGLSEGQADADEMARMASISTSSQACG